MIVISFVFVGAWDIYQCFKPLCHHNDTMFLRCGMSCCEVLLRIPLFIGWDIIRSLSLWGRGLRISQRTRHNLFQSPVLYGNDHVAYALIFRLPQTSLPRLSLPSSSTN